MSGYNEPGNFPTLGQSRSNIALDLDTSEDLDLLTLEQRNNLFKDNDN